MYIIMYCTVSYVFELQRFCCNSCSEKMHHFVQYSTVRVSPDVLNVQHQLFLNIYFCPCKYEVHINDFIY